MNGGFWVSVQKADCSSLRGGGAYVRAAVRRYCRGILDSLIETEIRKDASLYPQNGGGGRGIGTKTIRTRFEHWNTSVERNGPPGSGSMGMKGLRPHGVGGQIVLSNVKERKSNVKITHNDCFFS